MEIGRGIKMNPMLEEYDIARELKQTRKEQIVLNMWNKGLMPESIEAETGFDLSEIEDIIECERNYRGKDGR